LPREYKTAGHSSISISSLNSDCGFSRSFESLAPNRKPRSGTRSHGKGYAIDQNEHGAWSAAGGSQVENFFASVIPIGGDVMTPVSLTGGGVDRQRRLTQRVM
jgi:hypothetical protein